MNRLLKFRIWLSDDKVLVDFDHFYVPDGELAIGFLAPNHPDGVQISEADWFNAEIMQFTGLHDKAGNNIYEGDIVKNRDDKITVVGDYNDFIYTVHYSEDHSGLEGNTQEDLLVIGNIYENPELLGDVK